MNPPVITVLLPVYNAARYLPECLDSLRQQEGVAFSILAVDDGSTDDSPAVLRAYASRFSHFTILRNDQNIGLTRSLIRGVDYIQTPWVARLDADDLARPLRLQRQWEAVRDCPQVGLCYTGWQGIDRDGKLLETNEARLRHMQLRWTLLFDNPIAHSTVFMRRDDLLACGGYRCEVPYAEDYDLWIRLSARTQTAAVADPLVAYRIHDQSISATKRIEQMRSHLFCMRQMADALGVSVSWQAAKALYRVANRIPLTRLRDIPRTAALLFRLKSAFLRHEVCDAAQARELNGVATRMAQELVLLDFRWFRWRSWFALLYLSLRYPDKARQLVWRLRNDRPHAGSDREKVELVQKFDAEEPPPFDWPLNGV